MLSAPESKRWVGGEFGWGEVLRYESRPGSGGDHGGVVSGKGQRGERDDEMRVAGLRSNRRSFDSLRPLRMTKLLVAAGGIGSEAGAEFAVGGYSTCNEDAADAEGFGGGEGLFEQVADNGVLEAGPCSPCRKSGCP